LVWKTEPTEPQGTLWLYTLDLWGVCLSPFCSKKSSGPTEHTNAFEKLLAVHVFLFCADSQKGTVEHAAYFALVDLASVDLALVDLALVGLALVVLALVVLALFDPALAVLALAVLAFVDLKALKERMSGRKLLVVSPHRQGAGRTQTMVVQMRLRQEFVAAALQQRASLLSETQLKAQGQVVVTKTSLVRLAPSIPPSSQVVALSRRLFLLEKVVLVELVVTAESPEERQAPLDK